MSLPTSSEPLNISRRYSDDRYAGQPLRENRRRRPTKQRPRLLRFANSSSSSVDSDLAYGQGFISRPAAGVRSDADADDDSSGRDVPVPAGGKKKDAPPGYGYEFDPDALEHFRSHRRKSSVV